MRAGVGETVKPERCPIRKIHGIFAAVGFYEHQSGALEAGFAVKFGDRPRPCRSTLNLWFTKVKSRPAMRFDRREYTAKPASPAGPCDKLSSWDNLAAHRGIRR
jgi:hypothetical protein